MWDVSGTGAALQEGFQPGGMLGRGWKGVTLGMAPHIPHLYLYSASHPGALFDLAMGWGSSVGQPGIGVWERLSAHPRQEEGWICASTAGLWVGQGNAVALGSASPWDSSSLWLPKGAACHASLSIRGRYQGPGYEWVGSGVHKRPSSSPAIARSIPLGEPDEHPPSSSSHPTFLIRLLAAT